MKRREYQGPAILSHGFRPFFLAAGVSGIFLVPTWLFLFLSGGDLPSGMSPLDWHIHEMIFGYLAAVVSGFLLTAIPNWTGRLPISGRPLLLLVLLWVGGRVLMIAPATPELSAVGDSLFLVVMAIVAGREVKAGKNWRNLPVCVLVSILALCNIVFHMESMNFLATDLSVRAALSVLTMLVALIGGRIIPSFTTNWLIKVDGPARPVPFGLFDKILLALTGVALIAWTVFPEAAGTAWLLLAAALLHLVRLVRWKGWHAWPNVLVMVLHVAYIWLPVGLALLALSVLQPDLVPGSSVGIHSLTAGLMSMMTVAVMSRAILGHTGRALAAGRQGMAIYLLLFFAAGCRVLSAFFDGFLQALLMVSAGSWCLAFVLFAFHFGAMMLKSRVDHP